MSEPCPVPGTAYLAAWLQAQGLGTYLIQTSPDMHGQLQVAAGAARAASQGPSFGMIFHRQDFRGY